MSSFPTKERLEKNLARVVKDFGSHPSILDIRLRISNGMPVITAVGTNAAPPENFPTGISMKMKDGTTFFLPIQWRYSANPSDKQMWKGDSPVFPSVVSTKYAATGHAPVLVSEKKIPEAEEEQYHLSLPARLPGFVNPNFWAHPWEDTSASVCTLNYETWYTVYNAIVPKMSMIIIKGISYEFEDNLIINDQFEVRVMRDADNLCQYFDAKVANAVDPAEQYAFSGHYRQAPLYCRFDHDERILVQILVHGAYPFTHTPADFLGGCVKVYVTGWRSSLMDTRDGGARPSDFGEFNRIALEE